MDCRGGGNDHQDVMIYRSGISVVPFFATVKKKYEY